MTDDQEWSGTLTMNIDGVRMLHSHLEYSLKMWPGSPARPQEEQLMLYALKDEMFKMKMEHSLIFATGEKG